MNKHSKQLAGLSADFNHHDLAYSIVKPFGPSILETKIPDSIFGSFLKLSDTLLNDSDRRSYGKYLVGQIKEEAYIPREMLQDFGVYKYIETMFAEYVLGVSYVNAEPSYQAAVRSAQSSSRYSNPIAVTIDAAWLVDQKPEEYNPIHNHSGATLSSVLYLRVPPSAGHDPRTGKPSLDGQIEWVSTGAVDLQNSTVRVAPKAQYFYIFPSSLMHLVYPYRGGGERVSIAINASFRQ